MANRSYTQADTLDELVEDAQELYDAGDTVTADLLLFSAKSLALLNWHDPLERARRVWNADPSELEWR